MSKVPHGELQARLKNFLSRMDAMCPEWETVMLVNKINVFYLTGTQQSGVLVIRRGKDAVFYVRRSFYRAENESEFDGIVKINSFKDIAAATGNLGQTVYLEKEFLPLSYFERLNKYFGFTDVRSCDTAIAAARAVKTQYELGLMRRSGKLHAQTLNDFVPSVIREGMSEKELGSEILKYMLDMGHHGVARIAMFNTEMFVGQVCFGENSMYYNTFDGPGGIMGMSPATPLFGSDDRKLKKNELVFVDIGCGIEGYHTDKTQVYSFGNLPDEAYVYHKKCVDILEKTVSLLKPGNIPSKVYEEVMSGLDDEFLMMFMGQKDERVKFLGHGVGLVIDEYPVIAKGFDAPFEENMTMAVEPKRGIEGLGLVGLENTYAVTENGGDCLTGYNPEIIRIP